MSILCFVLAGAGRFVLPPMLRTLCVCEFLTESGAKKGLGLLMLSTQLVRIIA